MKYVYGIVWRGSSVGGESPGFNDRPIKEMGFKDIALIVSDVSSMAFLPEEEFALRHSLVVEDIFRHTCIMPMRFGTVFEDDGEVRKVLRDHYYRFREQLCFVTDKAEFGVRCYWEGTPASRRARSAWEKTSSHHKGPPGTRYLMKRRFEAGLSRTARQGVESFFSPVDGELSKLSEARKVRYTEVSRGMVEASYLVHDSRQRAFREKIIQLVPEMKILLTGPWPPYSFA